MASKRKPKPLKVADAVQRDLDSIAKLDKNLARSSMAASALALAREMDNPENSATSKSMCARALTEQLDHLRELAPDEEKGDKLDDLSARRATRLAGGAKATG